MESRVFWGVLTAMLVFSGLVTVSWALYVRYFEHVQHNSTMRLTSSAPNKSVLSAISLPPLSEAQIRALGPPDHIWTHYKLPADQRCVAGKVYTVNSSGASLFLLRGEPVVCRAGYGVVRIR